MRCPFCDSDIPGGELHYCSAKPPMIKVSWEMIKKFGKWLRGKFRAE